jgi:urease accessory protein UreF
LLIPQTMNGRTQLAPASATEISGNLAPLLEQLGSPEDIAMLGAVSTLLQCPRIESHESLARFLGAYRDQLLVRVELPAIFRAWQHASRFECGELIALDQQLGAEPMLRPFAMASQLAGRSQLRRLRPMRDQKLVQRYLKAIEAGEASGWHTAVYGLTLAIYSLPPRQGLLTYVRQTLTGFARSASRNIQLPEAGLALLVDTTCDKIPQAIGALVDAEPGSFFLPAAGAKAG